MSTPALFGNTENEASNDLNESAELAKTAVHGSASGVTQSLYRKFRPQTFDAEELVGQDAIVRTLKNAIQHDRVAHAYLFAGPRGTGKTTTARLLAKAVNCLDPDLAKRPCNKCAACLAISAGSAMDVVEIDAASNRGIDDIRELRERVKFAPAQLRTKFYIIDEAHQITGAAANAFLKTLEEPPAHTRFVLATTDPEQILATIVSRCQIFEFKRIPSEATKRRLAHVASQVGLTISGGAQDLIARQSDGSLRDALGLVDQLASYRRSADGSSDSPISVEDVRELLGLSRDELIVQMVVAIAERDAAIALGLLQQAVDRGAEPRQVARQIVQFLRAIMHDLASPASIAEPDVQRVSKMFSLSEAMGEAQRFSELDFKVRHSSIPQLPLEIGIVASVLRAAQPTVSNPEPVVTAPPGPAAHRQPVDDRLSQLQSPAAPVAKTATSLTDRVRSPAAPARQSAPAPTPEIVPNQDPGLSNSPGRPPAETVPGTVTINQIRAQWDQIRADVKARSRRVDALLVNVDPVAVQGDTVIMASAYPFHRNKLSEPDVQSIVEEVIGNLAGQRVRVSTVMHHEAPTYRDPDAGALVSETAPARPPALPVAAASPPAPNGQLSDDDRLTLDAAKNIFDAEEIDL